MNKGGPAMAELLSVPLRAKRSEGGSADSARIVRGWAGGQAPPVGPSDGVDLREVFQVVRRRKSIIVGCMALLTALTTVGVFQITPRYTADSIFMLETRKNQTPTIHPC